MENNLQRISITGIMANNLVFQLIDMIETVQSVSEREFTKAGFKMSTASKNKFLMLKYAVKDVRKITYELKDIDSQVSFGEKTDLIKEIILLIIDRFDYDKEKLEQIISDLRQHPSKLNINLQKFGV